MERVERQEEVVDEEASLCRGGEVTEGPVTAQNVYNHHDTHPLILDLFTTRLFGGEWFGWEPETLRMLIPRQGRFTISACNWNKLQACKTVHANPAAIFDRFECFLPVITAFNNVIPDPTALQPPSLARLLAGVGMLRMLDPQEEFSLEIRRFMAASLLYRGIFLVPDELEFLQHLLLGAYYVCPDCGNEEKVLDDFDGVCDYCGTDWYMMASGRKVKDPRVELRKQRDILPYRSKLAWVGANYDAWHPNEDDPVDVQVVRVVEAIHYKAKKDAQFYNQKSALGL